MKCPDCQSLLRCNETRTRKDGSILRKRTCEGCGKVLGTIETVKPDSYAGRGTGSNPKSHANIDQGRALSQETYRLRREGKFTWGL